MSCTYKQVHELGQLDIGDLSIIHSNINGAKSHLDDLIDVLGNCNNAFSLIGISETRLRVEEEVYFGVTGYSAFFSSRVATNPGGGVALLVRDNIRCRLRNQTRVPSHNAAVVESVFVEILGSEGRPNIIVGVLYRQPS